MDEVAQERACAAFFLESKAHTFRPAGDRAEWVHRRRIEDRADPSRLEWLNELIKTGLLRCDHIDNSMYLELVDNTLSDSELEQFLVAYYWGSGHGFQKIVLPKVLRGQRNEFWRDYIKGIIREEHTPSSHCMIFREFVESLGFEVATAPPSAEAFVQNMIDGYEADLGHAIGYALGIETEADYQISLLSLPFTERFPEAMSNTEFFDIHMDASGEEEHARATCETLEVLIAEGTCQQADIEEGFLQAVVDTREYLLAIHREVKGRSLALA